MVAAIALIVNSTIPVSTLTFDVIYGLSVVFPALTQWLLMIVLIFQARIYSWQLKEIAAKRAVTRDSSIKSKTNESDPDGQSSLRTRENDYSKDLAVVEEGAISLN